MVNYPEVYHRDYRQDLLVKLPEEEVLHQEEVSTWEKCQRIAIAALPLFSLFKPLRIPLTFTMSCIRTLTHSEKTIKNFSKQKFCKASFHFFHMTLAVATIGLVFFHPILAFLTAATSDFIINARNCMKNFESGDFGRALKNLAFMTLTLLLITSFFHGAFGITLICIFLQIMIDLYQAADHFIQENYVEGACQMLLSLGHGYNGSIALGAPLPALESFASKCAEKIENSALYQTTYAQIHSRIGNWTISANT